MPAYTTPLEAQAVSAPRRPSRKAPSSETTTRIVQIEENWSNEKTCRMARQVSVSAASSSRAQRCSAGVVATRRWTAADAAVTTRRARTMATETRVGSSWFVTPGGGT